MTVATRLPCDEALLRGGEPAVGVDRMCKRWVLAAAILGSSLAFVDGTVMNIALPAIQQALGASAAQVQWVVEAYALLLSALLLAGGAMGDRLGRRRTFLAGIVLFALASLACALAQTVHQLIAARSVQGVGAALLVPGSLALISATFPESERGPAFGTWAAFSGITSAIGPLVGGWLVDQASWAWAFAVNPPVAVLLLWITIRHVPDDRPAPARSRFDAAGAVWATLALGGAVFAFTEAPARGWLAPSVLGAAAVAATALAAFVRAERRHPAPMVPFALLRNRAFSGANVLTLLLYAGLGGGLFFLPLNLVQVQGLSATAAGAALLPFILVMFVLSRWAGGLVQRHGAQLPLVAGPALASAGFALLAWPGVGASYWAGFLPGVLVLGLGMSIAVAPLTTVVMAAVPPASAGVASGINNAVSRVAGVLAIAVFGWLLASVFDPHLRAALTGTVPPDLADAAWAQRGRLAALQPPASASPEAALAIRGATKAAFVAGFRAVMLTSAALALASAWVAWATIPRGEVKPHPGR
ncbi:MFS transporter [Ramlibacter sp. MMS24-I3-19]|uniref:MFS transporter n=1 Tax=Ramlibacter sp. MMS24-I3-19 TaxID=3416606 RepID=UPI003D03DBD7